MIPKIIHYCWFGGKPIPQTLKMYMNSWSIFFPDYKIIRWDETNFNIHCNKYVEKAYFARKYAFVSDYARFYILLNHGGVYFDTDVEVIKNMDDIIKSGPFLGEQVSGRIASGLGLGAEPGMSFLKEIIDLYDQMDFNNPSTSKKQATVVQHVTDCFLKHGYKPNCNYIQNILGFNIYPPDYFNPQDYHSGLITLTNNTRTIHHFSETWKPLIERKYHKWSKEFQSKHGKKGYYLVYLFFLPYFITKKIFKEGILGLYLSAKKKI